MKSRFALYLSVLMALLLPLEAGFAAVVCVPGPTPLSAAVAAERADQNADSREMVCGDEKCSAACLAICQSFPLASSASDGADRAAMVASQPYRNAFLLLPSGGPEPPPPRSYH